MAVASRSRSCPTLSGGWAEGCEICEADVEFGGRRSVWGLCRGWEGVLGGCRGGCRVYGVRLVGLMCGLYGGLR